MKTATVKDVMSWKPCKEYTEAVIAKLFDGRESMTVLDALELKIPIKRIFWIVLREELIPSEILHEFACRCADRALGKVKNPDEKSLNAPIAKRKWLKGEITDEELSKAKSAALATAMPAALATIWVAEGLEAWDLAMSVARAATWAAEKSAEKSATLSATWAARAEKEEQQWQLAELKKII